MIRLCSTNAGRAKRTLEIGAAKPPQDRPKRGSGASIMRTPAMKGIRIARLGLTLGAGLLAAALATGAQAQEGELMKNLLSTLGVIDDEKDPIEYRERAPLVLPPLIDLLVPAAPRGLQSRSPLSLHHSTVAVGMRREA